MSNEKQLVGQELVDFLMSRWNMTGDGDDDDNQWWANNSVLKQFE